MPTGNSWDSPLGCGCLKGRHSPAVSRRIQQQSTAPCSLRHCSLSRNSALLHHTCERCGRDNGRLSSLHFGLCPSQIDGRHASRTVSPGDENEICILRSAPGSIGKEVGIGVHRAQIAEAHACTRDGHWTSAPSTILHRTLWTRC